MGGAPVGLGPGLLSREQRSRIGQALVRDQALESHKPMIIVTRTVVRFPATRGDLELVGEGSRPFLPCEIPLLGELHRERKRLGLPRLGKHRPALVSRQPRQRMDARSFQYRIRPIQGSRPTYRDTRHRAMRLSRPPSRAWRTRALT